MLLDFPSALTFEDSSDEWMQPVRAQMIWPWQILTSCSNETMWYLWYLWNNMIMGRREPLALIRCPWTIKVPRCREKPSILTSRFQSSLSTTSSYIFSHPQCSIYGLKDSIKGSPNPSHFCWPNFCRNGDDLNVERSLLRVCFFFLVSFTFCVTEYENLQTLDYLETFAVSAFPDIPVSIYVWPYTDVDSSLPSQDLKG